MDFVLILSWIIQALNCEQIEWAHCKFFAERFIWAFLQQKTNKISFFFRNGRRIGPIAFWVQFSQDSFDFQCAAFAIANSLIWQKVIGQKSFAQFFRQKTKKNFSYLHSWLSHCFFTYHVHLLSWRARAHAQWHSKTGTDTTCRRTTVPASFDSHFLKKLLKSFLIKACHKIPD